MTKRRRAEFSVPITVPIKPISRVLVTLLEHTAGATEQQIAAVNRMSLRKVHRAVVPMLVTGLILVHRTKVGDLFTVNLNHQLVDPMLELLSGTINRDDDRIEKLLKLREHGVSVAFDWRSHVHRPANVFAAVPEDTSDEYVAELRTHLERELGRCLPTPHITVLTWAAYRDLLRAGDAAARNMWEHGDQLAGDGPITHEALRYKLRWSLINLRVEAATDAQFDGERA